MSYSKILYQNKMAIGTLTVTSTETGFSIDNIHDWRRYTLWKAANVNQQNIDLDAGAGNTYACNAAVIYGHNLGTEGFTGANKVKI